MSNFVRIHLGKNYITKYVLIDHPFPKQKVLGLTPTWLSTILYTFYMIFKIINMRVLIIFVLFDESVFLFIYQTIISLTNSLGTDNSQGANH